MNKKNYQIYFPNATVEKISSHFFLFVCNKFTRFYFDQSKLINFLTKQLKKKEKIIANYVFSFQYISFFFYLLENAFRNEKFFLKKEILLIGKKKKNLAYKFENYIKNNRKEKKVFFVMFFIMFSDFIFSKCKTIIENSLFLSFFFKDIEAKLIQEKITSNQKKNFFLVQNENLIYYQCIFKLFNHFRMNEEKKNKVNKQKFLGKKILGDNSTQTPKTTFSQNITNKELAYLKNLSTKRLEKIKSFYTKSNRIERKNEILQFNKLNYFKNFISLSELSLNKLSFLEQTILKNHFRNTELFIFSTQKKKIFQEMSTVSMHATKNLNLKKPKNFLFKKCSGKNNKLFFSKFFIFFLKLIHFFFLLFFSSNLYIKKKNMDSTNILIDFLQHQKLDVEQIITKPNFDLNYKRIFFLSENKNNFIRFIAKVIIKDIERNYGTKKMLLFYFRILKKYKNQHFWKKKIEFHIQSNSNLIQSLKNFNFFLENCFEKNQTFLKNCLEKIKIFLKTFLILEKIEKHQSIIIEKKNIFYENWDSKNSFFFLRSKNNRKIESLEKHIQKLRKNLTCADLSNKNKIIDILRSKINCPIKIFLPKDVVIVKCGHLFSSDCIKDLIASRNRRCPLCGTTFGIEGVKPIFLN